MTRFNKKYIDTVWYILYNVMVISLLKGIFVKMKKIFRITALMLLSLLLIISMVSCGSSAPKSDTGACGSGLTWSYDADTKALSISGNGTMNDYATQTELPWSAAIAYAKTLTVSEGVANIGNFAFYGFTALESVNLPSSLKTIGKSAFAYNSALTSINLPSTLEVIGDSAFEGCSALTVAVVPASVKTLGTNVFAYCSSVKNAAVFADIAISDGTFYNCRSIENLTIFSGISADKVHENAFKGAKKSFADANLTDSQNALATVTVKYIDNQGNQLFEPFVEADKPYGATYSHVPPTKEGYTADKLTVSGTVYGVNVEETVTYTPNAPVETEAPGVTEQPAKEKTTTSTIIAVVILGVVLVGIAVAAFVFIRSEKKNAAKSTTVRKNNTNDKKRK